VEGQEEAEEEEQEGGGGSGGAAAQAIAAAAPAAATAAAAAAAGGVLLSWRRAIALLADECGYFVKRLERQCASLDEYPSVLVVPLGCGVFAAQGVELKICGYIVHYDKSAIEPVATIQLWGSCVKTEFISGKRRSESGVGDAPRGIISYQVNALRLLRQSR
jgi:hypothetical protein